MLKRLSRRTTKVGSSGRKKSDTGSKSGSGGHQKIPSDHGYYYYDGDGENRIRLEYEAPPPPPPLPLVEEGGEDTKPSKNNNQQREREESLVGPLDMLEFTDVFSLLEFQTAIEKKLGTRGFDQYLQIISKRQRMSQLQESIRKLFKDAPQLFETFKSMVGFE